MPETPTAAVVATARSICLYRDGDDEHPADCMYDAEIARVLNAFAAERIAEWHRVNAKRTDAAELGCPCRWTTPCTPRCTCVTPGSSTGCARCCRYGSDEQRRARAQVILAAEKALARIATFGNHLGPSDEAGIARAAIDNALELAQKAVLVEIGVHEESCGAGPCDDIPELYAARDAIAKVAPSPSAIAFDKAFPDRSPR